MRPEKCSNCRFWECIPRFYMNGSDFTRGECRRSCLRQKETKDTYWCGEHEPLSPAHGSRDGGE